MSNMIKGFTLLLFCSTLSSFLIRSSAGDTLAANGTLRDGDTIVSVSGEFELGFFSPISSRNRYLSIRYKNVVSRTIVWVANRKTPLSDASGMLKFSSNGTLTLLDGTNSMIWSSNTSKSLKNPMAQLLDSGNLVVRTDNDPHAGIIFWQSFDFPDNTLLPGMKIGKNLATGLEWSFSSWKNNDDPSPGNYKVSLNTSGFPQIFVSNGSAMYFRFGPWNGIRFNDVPFLGPNEIYTYDFVFNKEEIYYKYDMIDNSVLMRITTEPDGQVRRYTWTNQSNTWQETVYLQADQCSVYARCGPYSSCSMNSSSICVCLYGFKPQNAENWKNSDFSKGCVPQTPLNCSDKNVFVKFSNKKLPDTRNSSYDFSLDLEKCKRTCLKDCSCTAYANTNITGKASGCLLWFGKLVDIRDQGQNEQDLYVRTGLSGSDADSRSRARRIALTVLLPIILSLSVVVSCYLLYICKYKTQIRQGEAKFNEEDYGKEDLPLFDFKTIANATNNFSISSKLGEGGFGTVYKGILGDGLEIAVKRRSISSTQGLEEFRNEVSIAKLQHRNLVRLLGWSTDEGERMLIYEYMPNRSLDYFIFGDSKQRASLDWPKRYNIINGIARGLLYLHQDSRLRVIHRDLKASNILLDYDLNPRISDFGTARSFGGSETELKTARVVGTYGYMSPEYAIEGAFSVKSDVYSLGVIVIEIVSGKKNRFFDHPDHNLNLLGHAWTIFKEHKHLELYDESILESVDQNEVFRVIQIGLLCVQQYPEDRPNMSTVLIMLSSNVSLPSPKQPGFFTERKLDEAYFSSKQPRPDSLSSNLDSSLSTQTVTFYAPR